VQEKGEMKVKQTMSTLEREIARLKTKKKILCLFFIQFISKLYRSFPPL